MPDSHNHKNDIFGDLFHVVTFRWIRLKIICPWLVTTGFLVMGSGISFEDIGEAVLQAESMLLAQSLCVGQETFL